MATDIYRQKVTTAPGGQKQVFEERITRHEDGQITARKTGRYAGIGILYFILDVGEGLLALRLILKLLAANQGNAFVSFVYQVTNPLIAPFRSALAPTVTQGTVIEWSTVLAMTVYALVIYAIVRLAQVPSRPAEQ